MSDSEDFLLNINAEELYPEASETPLSQKRKSKRERRKKRKRKMKVKISKITPNHFIAFQIYNSVIKEKIADIQKKLIEKNPIFNSSLIDPRTLHVTLAVTHLKNEESARELREKLQDWGEKNIQTHFSEPMELTFKGIGTFRNAVAFVKINECANYERLRNLSLAVNDLLKTSGFYAESERKFTPHLTLLKLSRDYKLMREKKNLTGDMETLSMCDDDFGSQQVRDIQLLSMNAKKDDNGYYKCLWQMKTGVDSGSNAADSNVVEPSVA